MSVDWDFGDGNTSTAPIEEPVTHTYVEPGDHAVTATVAGRPVEGPTVPARSRNLLPEDNSASFEPVTGGGNHIWNRGTFSTDRAAHGSRSLRYQVGNTGYYISSSRQTPPISIGGRLLTVMGAIWVDNPALLPRLSIAFYNAANSFVGSGVAELPAEVGQWTQLRFEVTPDPAAVDYTLSAFARVSSQIGDVYYLDRVGVFLGSVPWEGWSLPSEFVP